ncbi:Mitochondrial pyruvate carrier 1 [Picochlorum sp. SENEW3]|nr:Mitochondrial pyruvate carrier 1 [Picochlorum sp. SENEW3]|mmetsp:Transcript_3459/g.7018  ORF Transcript_3459/g.7018 Transcript_3459/m.7018 type:complete len:123 (+) Transcript_3459:1440-1808(+)
MSANAAKTGTSMVHKLKAWISSPTGPKTTHFWGPVANWGFVVAGIADSSKPAEMISPNMTAAMCVYSLLFMRFAWMIEPRNYILFACHASNEAVQMNQMRRYVEFRQSSSSSSSDTKAERSQ